MFCSMRELVFARWLPQYDGDDLLRAVAVFDAGNPRREPLVEDVVKSGRLSDLALHPTVKPLALVADAIRDCSIKGDIVLDPFIGSGTTIMAAEKTGRRAYGMEIDPLYVDVAIRRWKAATKADATLAGDGRTFEEIAAERSNEVGRAGAAASQQHGPPAGDAAPSGTSASQSVDLGWVTQGQAPARGRRTKKEGAR